MKKLLTRLAGLLLAFALLQLSSCTPVRHASQASGPTLHRYHRAERRNEHRRRRLGPPQLPWAGPDFHRVRRLDSATARNWAAPGYLFQP